MTAIPVAIRRSMEQVLNLGRYTATLVAKDFANWLQERTYIEKGRSELSQRYAGLCNERWENYLSLRGQKQRTIGQKLLAALQGMLNFFLQINTFLILTHSMYIQ